jgi:ribosomal protein L12E/L44/L45/RPP1/RPP2
MLPDSRDGRRANAGDAAPTALLAADPANSYDPHVPLTVHFDHRRRWVLVRGTGAITADEILSVIRTARTSVEHQMWPMLVDALEATTTMTDEDIEAAVEAVRQAIATGGRRGHVAIAADDDGLYARMLLYETRCAEIGAPVIRVFRRSDDAAHWLEIMSAARNFH